MRNLNVQNCGVSEKWGMAGTEDFLMMQRHFGCTLLTLVHYPCKQYLFGHTKVRHNSETMRSADGSVRARSTCFEADAALL